MSEERPVTRSLAMDVLSVQLLGPVLATEALGMTEPLWGEGLHPTGDPGLVQCLEGRNQVALRLACIGDEMELHVRGLHRAQLPGTAMSSLAHTYSQTGAWGVLRSFIHGLTNCMANTRSWRSLSPGTWVSPGWACRQLLPVMLLALLLGGTLRLLLL